MSRSFKHVPFSGNCGGSDSEAKRFARKALRRAEKLTFGNCASEDDMDEVIFPHKKEISDVYSFPMDGKRFASKEFEGEALRK
jgi:hypothetical protein